MAAVASTNFLVSIVVEMSEAAYAVKHQFDGSRNNGPLTARAAKRLTCNVRFPRIADVQPNVCLRPNRGHSIVHGSSSEVAVQCGVDELGFRAALLEGFAVNAFPQGTVHEAGEDFQAAVRSNPEILVLWEGLTPLARNEFICWVDDAKQPATRRRRIERTCDELLEGKKRPCCWAGCIHRTDKAPSRWQQAVLIDKKGRIG